MEALLDESGINHRLLKDQLDELIRCCAASGGADPMAILLAEVGEALGTGDGVDRLGADAVEEEAEPLVEGAPRTHPLAGPAATRAIVNRAKGTKVILLSSYHGGPRQLHDAAAAGASGVLRKNVDLEDLVHLIDCVLRGAPHTAGGGVQPAPATDRHSPDEIEERWSRLMTLTGREVEVLQVLSRGYPLRQTAGELGLALGTLKNYLHRVLEKTGTANQLEAVDLARHYGLVRELGPPEAGPG